MANPPKRTERLKRRIRTSPRLVMTYRRGAVDEPRRRRRVGGAPVTQHIPSTEPELAGVRNFRDVGGLPTLDGRRVRHGALFRSGHLAHATAADSAFLSALVLHTVFDFLNVADFN